MVLQGNQITLAVVSGYIKYSKRNPIDVKRIIIKFRKKKNPPICESYQAKIVKPVGSQL
jgi:hypothetical protein